MQFAFDAGDTVAAVCTPGGNSACGIIRLSGGRAREIADALFAPTVAAPLAKMRKSGVVSGFLTLDFTPDGRAGALPCPALAWVMPRPHSYTGEDVVELHLPGGPPLLRAALRGLCAAGARPARGGEYTLRAFLNGRLDLGQAEAVGRLIAAESETDRRAALGRLTENLSARLAAWRGTLLQAAAKLEATLDFAEEELDAELAERLQAEIEKVASNCEGLAGDAARGNPERTAPRIALCGLVNAGKSSLANALCGRQVALADAAPSTTRDRLVFVKELAGAPMQFEDLPGGDFSSSALGAAASAHAATQARGAALILLVVDGARPECTKLAEFVRTLPETEILPVINKLDLLPAEIAAKVGTEVLTLLQREKIAAGQFCAVSAATGAGVAELLERVRAALAPLATTSDQILPGAREAAELCEAALHCRAAAGILAEHRPPELAAEELRGAHAALARAGGEGYADEVLEHIFSRFCVGK